MNKYLFLLDAGHGGVIDGVPQTEGKRSPWTDTPGHELALYEGEFNRAIVSRIMEWAPLFGVRCLDIVRTLEDLPLRERVKRANTLKNDYPDLTSVYISIHANAGGGHGFEVFTSPGQTSSDPIATEFLEKLSMKFPNTRLRTDFSDGDPDKEARFYVLTKTAMSAILIEEGFMDNPLECKFLLSERGRDRIALTHLAAMVEMGRWTNA